MKDFFKGKMQEMQDGLSTQAERIALYKHLNILFNGFEFPEKLYTYCWESGYRGTIHIEFSPDSEEKDLQKFIHALVQKFGCKLERSVYGEDSIEYNGNFTIGERRYALRIYGVVPGSCTIEETSRELSDEEFEAEKLKALSSVSRTKVTRKIICVEPNVIEPTE